MVGLARSIHQNRTPRQQRGAQPPDANGQTPCTGSAGLSQPGETAVVARPLGQRAATNFTPMPGRSRCPVPGDRPGPIPIRAPTPRNPVSFAGSPMPTSRRFRRLAVPVIVLAAAVGPWRPAWLASDVVSTAQPAAKVDFATQIEPILREQCYECHGEKKGRGKLRLHIRDLALKGGATGPAARARRQREELHRPAAARRGRRRPDAARQGSAERRADRRSSGLDRSGRRVAGDAGAATPRRRRPWRSTGRTCAPKKARAAGRVQRGAGRARPSIASCWRDSTPRS